MSEFGGGADVQQIHLLALVMNAVLPGSANNRPLESTENGYLKAAVNIAIDVLSFSSACSYKACCTHPY